MADSVQNAMFDILKRIQSDVSGIKTDVSSLKSDVADIKGRVERLEELAIKQRRDSAAMLVMFRQRSVTSTSASASSRMMCSC